MTKLEVRRRSWLARTAIAILLIQPIQQRRTMTPLEERRKQRPPRPALLRYEYLSARTVNSGPCCSCWPAGQAFRQGSRDQMPANHWARGKRWPKAWHYYLITSCRIFSCILRVDDLLRSGSRFRCHDSKINTFSPWETAVEMERVSSLRHPRLSQATASATSNHNIHGIFLRSDLGQRENLFRVKVRV